MLFVIQSSAMNGVETVLYALDEIVARVEDDVHELHIFDADLLEDSGWYRSSRPDRRKILEGFAEESLYRAPRTEGPHLRRVEVEDAASAARARSVAYAPLLVLLENDISDGVLVEMALRLLAKPVTVELCFGAPSRLEPPAFQMESRGGHGELKKRIAKLLDEAASRGRWPRFVVVTDSDGEWPTEVKDYAQEIREECAANGVACPPLNKRTAENYIPDAIWRAWAASPEHTAARPWVEALLRLSPEQRDHVNMGASNKLPWDPNKPEVAAIFQNPAVSTGDRDLLCQAHLKGKGENMLILALRDHAVALTRADMMARDHHGDLMLLVRHIEDEL